jgi:hypothetical protein
MILERQHSIVSQKDVAAMQHITVWDRSSVALILRPIY